MSTAPTGWLVVQLPVGAQVTPVTALLTVPVTAPALTVAVYATR